MIVISDETEEKNITGKEKMKMKRGK